MNISYSISTFLVLSLIKSIISLLSAFNSFVKFKLIFLPNLSIKKRGEPIHFILPSDKIPILLPNTEASSI